MNHHLRFIMTLAIIGVCATLEVPQAAGAVLQSAPNGKVETSYDQVKEITTVRLNPMQVYGEPLASSQYVGGDEASFDASFSYSGQTLRAPPKRILFSLTSTSQNWKYTDFPKLTALVDGKLLNLGPLEQLPSFSVNPSANTNSDDYISQGITVSLTYKTFLRIANGNKVQIRMGPRQFDLVGNHLEALRYLATLMVP
jgi:hypothetical protein